MAERFAPKVWLADGDEYGPMDASRFIANSELWFHAGCTEDPSHLVEEEVDPSRLGDRGDAYTTTACFEQEPVATNENVEGCAGCRGFFLNLDDSEDIRRGDGSEAPVYWEFYRKDAHTTAIVYWLHYAYNDFINNHEGDWERVAVQLADGEPIGVTFWKHNEDPCLVEWGELERDGDHPVTYSGAGSHGSYDRAGTYDAAPGPGHPVVDTTSPAESACGATTWGRYGRERHTRQ